MIHVLLTSSNIQKRIRAKFILPCSQRPVTPFCLKYSSALSLLDSTKSNTQAALYYIKGRLTEAGDHFNTTCEEINLNLLLDERHKWCICKQVILEVQYHYTFFWGISMLI